MPRWTGGSITVRPGRGQPSSIAAPDTSKVCGGKLYCHKILGKIEANISMKFFAYQILSTGTELDYVLSDNRTTFQSLRRMPNFPRANRRLSAYGFVGESSKVKTDGNAGEEESVRHPTITGSVASGGVAVARENGRASRLDARQKSGCRVEPEDPSRRTLLRGRWGCWRSRGRGSPCDRRGRRNRPHGRRWRHCARAHTSRGTCRLS